MLHEKLPKETGIYMIKNLIDNKVYIGQTLKDGGIYRRVYEHYFCLINNRHGNPHLQRAWNKYGENAFVCYAIEIINSRDLLDEREKYWISYYNSTDMKFGYNIQSGGSNNIDYTEECKERMALSQCKYKIYQYDCEGQLIKIWDNTREIYNQLGINSCSISSCCLGYKKRCHGYTWSYTPLSKEEILLKTINGNKERVYPKELKIKYTQINENNQIINILSMDEFIDLGFNQSNISKCIKNNTHFYKGFYWFKYQENLFYDVDEFKIYDYTKRLMKPVYQYTLKGELVNMWNNPLDASEGTNIKYKYILKCLNGTRKSTCGFMWKFDKL